MEPTGDYERGDDCSRERAGRWDRLGELASGIHYRAGMVSNGGASSETVQRLLREVDQFVVLGRRCIEDLREADPRDTR